MKKLILITLLLLSFAPAAFAHSHLENSTPGNGEVVTEELREIVLTFSGEVEQGSTFELLDSNRKAISIEEMSITDTEVIGTIPNGLENGKYILAWNIISADGHQMDGEYSFEVNLAEAETPPANNNNEDGTGNVNGEVDSNQKDVTEQDTEQNTSKTVNDKETAAAGDQAENEDSSNLVPILVVVLLLVIVIIFIALRRKK